MVLFIMGKNISILFKIYIQVNCYETICILSLYKPFTHQYIIYIVWFALFYNELTLNKGAGSLDIHLYT